MNETDLLNTERNSLAIETKNLSRLYSHGSVLTQAVYRVELAVRRGEFVAIMGPSGSGKSTLLNLIAGLVEPTEGYVQIDGVRISDLGDADRSRLRCTKMGFVFQSFNLIGFLTVQENIELPRSLGWKILNRHRAVEDLLSMVGLESKMKYRVSELSAGEQQRVAIARALINDPVILLADEPTGNLDSRNARAIVDLLREFNHNSQVTVLLVTHNLEVALMADKILELRDGRIQRGWKANELRVLRESERKLWSHASE